MRITLSNVIIGDKITDNVYCLKSMHKGNDKYNVVLKDKTGELNCELALERYTKDLETLVGGAVKVTLVVINGLNTTPLGVIKSIAKADNGSFKMTDIFDGLSADTINRYLMTIKDCISHISDPALKALVIKVLDNETLKQLASLPATLNYHGRYRGGALATTAAVTKLAIQGGYQYCSNKNGLYEPKLDWNILISASLLAYVGAVDYFTHEPPFRMTPVGLERGYMSVLQRRIEQAADDSISEITLARLFNVLASSIPAKSSIKSTRQEGLVLRKCLSLYAELDVLDYEMSIHEAEEGEEYFYNYRLKRNIKLPEEEDKVS